MIYFLSYLLFPAAAVLVIGLFIAIFIALPLWLKSLFKKSKSNNTNAGKFWKKIVKASVIVFILSLIIVLANQYYIPQYLRKDFKNLVSNFKPNRDRIYIDSSLVQEPSFLIDEMKALQEVQMNSSLSSNSVSLVIESQNQKLALDCIQDRDNEEGFWLYFSVPNTRTRHPIGLIHSPELYNMVQTNNSPDN